ncbi:hypothetical protein LUZ60_014954 [Juncus effusus]|nr:hypothetical protein LUZ60_014954 [Juncus effusus]
MGCFLGCFGGEAKEGSRERRRRRSGRRSPHRALLNRVNQSNGVFQSVAIELGQSSRRQITPRLSPSPSLEAKFPSLESPVESIAPFKPFSLEPPVESISEKPSLLKPPVDSVPSENPPLLDPPVEPVNPPVTEIREVKEQSSTSLPKKKVTFDLNVKTYECPNYPSDDEIQEDELVQEKLKLSPTRTAFPSNHRYQNWYAESETDEIEQEEELEEEDEDYYYYSDEEYEELDEIDEILGIDGNEEESYESLFSLSIDKEKEMNSENNENRIEEVSSAISENTPEKKAGLRDRSQFVHPVLNPVENLSQWKEVKFNNNSEKSEKITTINNNNNNNSNLEKENKNSDLNNNNNNNGLIKREVSVDASLSTWLVSSEVSTVDQGQNGSFTERPILGALTVDDMKQSSVNSSPRRSPSREDEPIIGTVGTYWNCTSTGSSRFKEDKITKCR